ncbi:uncharacterized protein LOC134819277 isoform X2 [Bolinopsis microptera]|uniref:uncharacterized protein LOC134819277 isoform X2 n=1 Tax=Bolinopsis microptera TaxID=2820187 RepID=UPI003078DC69
MASFLYKRFMSKQVRLPLNNRDVSRFFNNSVYNRSIKLWVNNVCFTCSRLILAQHSSIFEQHLRDSPPSVLLEDFHNIEGAENGIQDALILLYGGAITMSMRNIQVLSRFATIYRIKELLNLSMEWIKNNLGVENVMIFFKALQTVDSNGDVQVPDVIRKFMEEKTGPIVDHLLSSSDNIDDEFLLDMLELPSSSILVQRCLKAGMLPDPIVELIFKHSNTINVNFLLHDDKRTYVRLITILKSKARSYKDMEKIIDIQQKCISKMCHPYGSVDSLATGVNMAGLTPAPSIATIAPPSSRSHNAFQPVERPRREEYHPKSLEKDRENGHTRRQNNNQEAEYLMPEELKHKQDSRFLQDFKKEEPPLDQGRGSFRSHRDEPPPEEPQGSFRSNSRPPFHMRDSSQETDIAPDFNAFNHDRNREDPVEKSFTSQHQNQDDRMPASVVAQLKQNLAKNFVAKFPDQGLKSRAQIPQIPTNYDDNKDNYASDAETYLEDHNKRTNSTSVNSGMKSLSLGRNNRPISGEPEGDSHKTNYAQVYMKKSQLLTDRDNKLMDKMNVLARDQAHNVTAHQDDMMDALNKLAEQQAIIEHTYDNMSILSGRIGPGRISPLRESSIGGKQNDHHPQPQPERQRAASSTSKRSVLAVDSVNDFEDDNLGNNRHNSDSNSLRAPIHIPTTFGTKGSARNSVRSNNSVRPPDLPSHPPPGATSFFAGGASEAESTPLERPPPTLHVPPPPKIVEHPPINLEEMSSLDSGLPPDIVPDLPPECLPDHDRMYSPPFSPASSRRVYSPPSVRSQPPASIASTRSRPFSPPIVEEVEVDDRGRSRGAAPSWSRPNNEEKIPITNLKKEAPNLTKEELIQHSAILLNKRSRSKSKERAKSRERKSMRKKKGDRAAKNISIPISSLDKEVKTLEHPTKGRPKKAKNHPPTSPISQEPPPANTSPPDRKPKPYHIKFIPSKIPDREVYFSSFTNSVVSDS